MIISEAEKARRREAFKVGLAKSVVSASAHAALILGDISKGAMREWAANDPECSALRREAMDRPREHDPAIQAAMDAVRTRMTPAIAWAKTKPDSDGNSYSVLLKPQTADDDILDRIAAAFDNIPTAPEMVAPSRTLSEMCSLYPIFDAHIGMHAWSRETGSVDYDLKLAGEDMQIALGKVLAITPDSGTAILLIGGDYFHADDNRAETPANRHKLDVDGRQFKVVDVGIGILAHAIEALVSKHQRVIVRVMRGNHDEHAHLILTYALAERYRNEPRCEVMKDPRDLFMFQWGRSAIFAHHGDKAKPQQMAMYLSDVCDFWSATKHRHFFSGHVHHDHAKDIGPLRWESLRAFCPPDAYAASMGYGGRRALQSITFHAEDGLVQRNYDPIQRVA